MTGTGPDLAFSVRKMAQLSAAPSLVHWQAVKRIIGYVKAMEDHGIMFQANDVPSLQCFSDCAWASCPQTSKLTNGFEFTLPDRPVLWRSKNRVSSPPPRARRNMLPRSTHRRTLSGSRVCSRTFVMHLLHLPLKYLWIKRFPFPPVETS